ncbi:MAG TPA: hypothetical protein VGO79_13775 [Thermoanaerobaculia bacterium]|jgi:hypothetical protein
MPPKALIGLIVADAVALVAFTLLLIFHVLQPRQVIFVGVPILFVLEAVFVVYVARRKRGSGGSPMKSSDEVRPR